MTATPPEPPPVPASTNRTRTVRGLTDDDVALLLRLLDQHDRRVTPRGRDDAAWDRYKEFGRQYTRIVVALKYPVD